MYSTATKWGVTSQTLVIFFEYPASFTHNSLELPTQNPNCHYFMASNQATNNVSAGIENYFMASNKATYNISISAGILSIISSLIQGRRRRSGRSGYGRTTFLPEMVLAKYVSCRVIFSRYLLDLF